MSYPSAKLNPAQLLVLAEARDELSDSEGDEFAVATFINRLTKAGVTRHDAELYLADTRDES